MQKDFTKQAAKVLETARALAKNGTIHMWGQSICCLL